MRGQKRNQKKLWYQLYSEHIPVYETDLDGNIVVDPVTGEPLLTGDNKVGYSAPVEFKANVSPARSDAQSEPFGVNTDYDKVVCYCGRKELPADELSLLFVDKVPEFGEDGKLMNKPDYKVVKPAKSLNSVLYAIKKMTEGTEHG